MVCRPIDAKSCSLAGSRIISIYREIFLNVKLRIFGRIRHFTFCKPLQYFFYDIQICFSQKKHNSDTGVCPFHVSRSHINSLCKDMSRCPAKIWINNLTKIPRGPPFIVLYYLFCAFGNLCWFRSHQYVRGYKVLVR